MNRIQQSKYARMKGVSPAYLHKLRNAGRLKVDDTLDGPFLVFDGKENDDLFASMKERGPGRYDPIK
jgi:hypothetical protein